MAVKKKEDNTIVVGDNKEINIVSPNLEKKVADIKLNEEVSIIKPTEAPVIEEKRVKVKMKEDHKCFIGGEWYYLLKDKQYNVPDNVKNILLKADKLSPL